MSPFALEQIGSGLAFSQHLGEFTDLLATGVCIVHAPPGSGKTTLAPPAVANHLARSLRGDPPRAHAGRVVVTGPRRISVRAAASRLAHLDHSPLGERVGFTVRGERVTGPDTIVEFLTPGVLLRRLLHDPELAGVGAVVLDEVHERSLDGDLLLGMLAEVRELREELVLVAMSATVEADALAPVLGTDSILRSTGRQHPVEVRYASYEGGKFSDTGVKRAFLDHAVTTTLEALTQQEAPAGDLLVFLPGRAEISYVSQQLSRLNPRVEVLELHSGTDPSQQQRILRGRAPEDQPRIIVSSAVAESSLTVPGVATVVDSCLAREPRRDARRQMTGLVTTTASRASSEQRAGRAGRLGPGRAYRLTDTASFAAAPSAPTPEVMSVDLTTAALHLACWGTPGGAGMPLPDPLPEQALAVAHTALRAIGAVDDDLYPTPLGRRLARLPLDPRLARALVHAATELGSGAAAELVAVLATDLRAQRADLPGLLRQLRAGTHPGAQHWRAETRRLQRLTPPPGAREDVDTTPSRPGIPTRDRLGYVAALGNGRIAKLDGASYLLRSGTRATLPASSPLEGEPWLVITDVARSGARQAADTGALIYAAAPISEALVREVHDLATVRKVRVQRGRVQVRVQERLGEIACTSAPAPPAGAEISDALISHIGDHGIACLPWTVEAVQLRGRLSAARDHLAGAWPDVSDSALTQNLDWIAPHITAPQLRDIPVAAALQSLAAQRMHELDRQAPRTITVPSGRAVRVDYPLPDQGGAITVSVKLQECFGLRITPRILAGRVPITLDLLSPAGRTLAMTKDLEFFWEEVYPQVRAENRARYAKHPWPENPWEHGATGSTRRQLQARKR